MVVSDRLNNLHQEVGPLVNAILPQIGVPSADHFHHFTNPSEVNSIADFGGAYERLLNFMRLFSGSGVLSGRHDGRAAKALGW